MIGEIKDIITGIRFPLKRPWPQSENQGRSHATILLDYFFQLICEIYVLVFHHFYGKEYGQY